MLKMPWNRLVLASNPGFLFQILLCSYCETDPRMKKAWIWSYVHVVYSLEPRLSIPDLSRSFVYLQSCETKSGMESLGSRLASLHPTALLKAKKERCQLQFHTRMQLECKCALTYNFCDVINVSTFTTLSFTLLHNPSPLQWQYSSTNCLHVIYCE